MSACVATRLLEQAKLAEDDTARLGTVPGRPRISANRSPAGTPSP
ncbi:hypothetical protein [Nonomuraea rubra]